VKNVQRENNVSGTLVEKDIYSTGELAALAHVTKRTIITAIEKGDLRASRTPGGHNRILREDAVDFLRRHNMLPEPTGKTVLIVDDESVVRDLIAQVLEGEGHRILHAENGYQAGRLAERERPDLIVLDIMLPDIDGREVCRHIREEDFGKECRIVAVTSLKDDEAVEEMLAAGIDEVLFKPFNVARLLAIVEELMQEA
jgi:excisionase family DNA binding protein